MKRFLLLFCIGIGLSAAACDDHKSTPVGSDVIDRDDWGAFQEIPPQSAARDSTCHATVSTHTSYLLLVGEWCGYKTKSLLKFEALPESVQVTSASLTLYTYDVIDTVTPLQPFVAESLWIVVSTLETDWDGSEITFDTPLSSTPVETVAVGRSPEDTLTFSLPTEIVQAWIDETVLNNGLLLDYMGNSPGAQGEGFIKEFYSTNTESVWPRLSIGWRADDTSDTTVTSPTSDAFVVNREPEWPFDTRADRLMVGNGFAYRSLLHFSLGDSIPPEATVIRGLLTHFVDPEYSFFNSLSLGIYAVTGPSWENPTYDSDQIIWTTVSADEDSAVFTIHSLVQDWVSGVRPNYGLMVRSIYEDRGIASIVFHSSQSDPAKKPRLDVAYFTPPEFGGKSIGGSTE